LLPTEPPQIHCIVELQHCEHLARKLSTNFRGTEPLTAELHAD
jgi:hypothetical protein